MMDTNEDSDGRFDQVDDAGDYNPESIDYEVVQDNDSNPGSDYASDDPPSNEEEETNGYDPGRVEPTIPNTTTTTTLSSIGQPPHSPTASRSPVASHHT